jgi:riboflavin biosynthesis pyrimidine reductase
LRAEDWEERMIGLSTDVDGHSLEHALSALRARGPHVLFIEGGGVTVSRWRMAGKLDRLQIATAPVLIGSGRSGISLPPSPTVKTCRRPPYRLYRMGEDLPWDFDLRGERGNPTAEDEPVQAPLRLL